MKWEPVVRRNGGRYQAGVPTGASTKANGLLLRGVVTATYRVDDPNNPETLGGLTPVAVYCDVLAYSSMASQRFAFYKTVLVARPKGGMHTGSTWEPRATTVDISNIPLDVGASGTNPANFDGDHVLMGFLDDSLQAPVILGSIPHPSVDIGNLERNPGNRLRLVATDGNPDFWKHNGSFYGVDTNGDFVADTTFANDGGIDETGNEAEPPTDGKGSHRFRLSKDSEHEVVLYDMASPASPSEVARIVLNDTAWEINFNQGSTLLVTGDEGDAAAVLGDGAVSVAIYEALQSFWDTMVQPVFNAHIHPTGVGPSNITATPFPTFDVAIKSSKLTIPDG